MPPQRGTYKTVADPALSEEQLSQLDKLFTEHRRHLTCPACSQTTIFHRAGFSTKEPYQPQFRCTSCNKGAKAFEMYELVVSRDTQGAQPDTRTTSEMDFSSTNFIEPPTVNSQPDIVQQLLKAVETLTTELAQARSEIQRLQDRINGMTSHSSQPFDADFPTIQESLDRDTTFPNAPWHNTDRVNALKQPSPQQREQRRRQREAAAARFFQPPSENQGFKYLYLPTKARIPVGTLRTTFRKLGVNNARLLDIHYPARNTVAILIHNDYETEFKEHLHHHGLTPNETFNPFSGTVLADPKYKDTDPTERDTIAANLQRTRLDRALEHIRAPVKFAVARYFYDQHWISKTKYDTILATRNMPLSSIFDQSQPGTEPASQAKVSSQPLDDDVLEMMDDISLPSTPAATTNAAPQTQH